MGNQNYLVSHHDNEPVHDLLVLSDHFGKYSMRVVPHPPYLSGLE